MKPTDLTIKILTEIRDTIRETNVRVDQTNVRLDETRAEFSQGLKTLGGRVDLLGDRVDVLGDRVVEAEIRTATAITALAGTLGDVKALLQDRLDVRDRVERCEIDIAILKERTGLR